MPPPSIANIEKYPFALYSFKENVTSREIDALKVQIAAFI
jgi:hypothetical protein